MEFNNEDSNEQFENNDSLTEEQKRPKINSIFFKKHKSNESKENNDIYKDGPSKTVYQADPSIMASAVEEDQTQDLQEENIEQYQPNSISNQNIQPQEFNQNNQQESNQNGQF